VIQESERLSRLINQVLDLAKLDSGTAEWQVSEIDVRQVILDCLDATGQLFRERDVALETRLSDAVAPVRADRDRLVQVLINLLSNAVKFVAPGQGRVVVALDETGGQLVVRVSDNGPGIAPADQKLIFEKFRQAGDAMTDRPQGTGLGLPISRQIIEHFGGRLWVESETGKGATFAFALPVVKTDEAARSAGDAARGAPVAANAAHASSREE
jgi:signal transduction histidine kinase